MVFCRRRGAHHKPSLRFSCVQEQQSSAVRPFDPAGDPRGADPGHLRVVLHAERGALHPGARVHARAVLLPRAHLRGALRPMRGCHLHERRPGPPADDDLSVPVPVSSSWSGGSKSHARRLCCSLCIFAIME